MPVTSNFTFSIICVLLLIRGISSIPTNVPSSTTQELDGTLTGVSRHETRDVKLSAAELTEGESLNGTKGLKNDSTNEDKGTCETIQCRHAASQIADYMDSKKNPCVDFYEFACGGYVKKTVLGGGEKGINPFTEAEKKIKEQLKIILEEESPSDEPKLFTKAKHFYRACVYDKSALSINVVEEILKHFSKFLGHWPLFEDSWQEENFDWKKLVFKSRELGFSKDALSPISVEVDSGNKTERVIRIGKSYLAGSSPVYADDIEMHYTVQLLLEAMRRNSKIGFEKADEQLQETVNFIHEIEKLPINLNEQALGPMTLEELEANYSMIPWREYISTILGPHFGISKKEKVLVEMPMFINEVEQLMRHTSKKTVANYLMLNAYVDACNHVFKSQDCSVSTSRDLKDIVNAMHMKKFFSDKSIKSRATEISEMIRREFQKILQEKDWIDDVTKTKISERAESLRIEVGYPDVLEDVDELTKSFEDLDIMWPTSYFDAILKVKLFKDKHPDVMKSSIIQSMKNIRYNPQTNKMRIPAFILGEPIFSIDRSAYLNFGALGMLIGHEIAHVFNEEFVTSDEFGEDTWRRNVSSKIDERLECFIRQYHLKDLKLNMTVNATRTLVENIADNGGLKVAYLAYQEWVRQNGREPRLPGLDYSPNQLFWISAAQLHCAKVKRKALVYQIENDIHSPAQFRIYGALSNRPEFAEDFKCNTDAIYNPQNRCSIW